MTESPSPIEPPVAPKRRPTLFERILARLPKPHHSAEPVQPLMTCSHLWSNGTSAWSACTWNGSYWQSRCARCGLVARCR